MHKVSGSFLARFALGLGVILVALGLYTSVGMASYQAPNRLPSSQSNASTGVGGEAPMLTPLSWTSAPVRYSDLDLPSDPQVVIYDQYDHVTPDAGSSQDFGPQYANYDAQAADDFVVPSGQIWQISSVDVAGVYSGTGTASSVNVFIYSGSVLPAAPIVTQTNIMPASGLQTGDFSVPLDGPVALGEGTYWVSVQANQDFPTNGQWFWRLRDTETNTRLAWRNPGNSFGRNCQSWGYFFCSPLPENRDLVFRLNGTINATPSPTVTGTPPTATATRTPVPPQPTATGTVNIPLPMLTAYVPLDTNTPTNTVTGTPPTSTSTPSPLSTPSGCYVWSVVSSPSPANFGNELHAIAAVGSSDIWAVGYYANQNIGGSWQTLIEHWNGSVWSVVPSPNMSTRDNYLFGVAAVASSDVWAVGFYTSQDDTTDLTLIEHWDGATWSVVPSPSPNPGNYLYAVSAIGGNDLWAVGYYSSVGVSGSLTEHWDGNTWSVVPSPNITQGVIFSAVKAISHTDVWAVGHYFDAGMGASRTLTEHWDGSTWSVIPSPNVGTNDDELHGVDALSSSDVWAVGYYNTGTPLFNSLVEHWDGSAWNVIPSPNVGTDTNDLIAVSAISSSDVWTTGWSRNTGGYSQTLTEHWDGSVWGVFPSSNVGNGSNELFAVSAISSSNVWAVGTSCCPSNTLIEQNSPCAGSPTPTSATATNTAIPTASATSTPSTRTPIALSPTATSPAPTSTSVLPSATPVAATRTPAVTVTATPTVCSLHFTDVPVGSTFYPYVRCLACKGIINGYPDGTFKPNNDVTRGQLSKIVSNAADFSDNQTTQMFQDVPVGSTFFQFIGRLASRGYIGGYACGGPGEPCVPPTNLPYFRPNNNATRGQISKIDSNAANFSDTPAGQQFEDVPVGSTYYTYTYRLVSRSIMAGYQCGGAGEPCIPPGNLPYFRPNNNATRGQTSKIVSNTFFPDCNPPAR